MRTEKNEGMNRRSLKEVRKSAASRKATKAKPETPTPATFNAKDYWRKLFASPGARFARQVAALFGFDWRYLEEWVNEQIDGCHSPQRERADQLAGVKTAGRWWNIAILQVYDAFYVLKESGVSDDDCVRGVEVIAPYAVEYWKAPRGKKKINGKLYQIGKDDESFACTLDEWRIFFDSLRRLFFFLQSLDSSLPMPELAELRGIRKHVGDVAAIAPFLLPVKIRQLMNLAKARDAARPKTRRTEEERAALSRALDEVQRRIDTGATDSAALEIVARKYPVPSRRARAGFLSKEGLRGAWKKRKAEKRSRDAEGRAAAALSPPG